MIGGTWSPFFGLIELPIEYPTIEPSRPVPALWSILPNDIKTVMQHMATSTISALGGLVMFILLLWLVDDVSCDSPSLRFSDKLFVR